MPTCKSLLSWWDCVRGDSVWQALDSKGALLIAITDLAALLAAVIAVLKQIVFPIARRVRFDSLFIGCVLYADDIVLFSASCHGLQQIVNICNVYGTKWDIKFNPRKSQVITFGGQNPFCQIMLNSNQIPWVNKVKYLGVHFCWHHIFIRYLQKVLWTI